MIREEESILIDGLSPKEMKQLREQSEKHIFQAEVNRMMKLIINSLYKNKEVTPCFMFFIGNWGDFYISVISCRDTHCHSYDYASVQTQSQLLKYIVTEDILSNYIE